LAGFIRLDAKKRENAAGSSRPSLQIRSQGSLAEGSSRGNHHGQEQERQFVITRLMVTKSEEAKKTIFLGSFFLRLLFFFSIFSGR
jgi:hypothetical protein